MMKHENQVKTKNYHFSTITEASEFFKFPKPEHPLFQVISNKSDLQDSLEECLVEPFAFTQDFYCISIKKIISGTLHYGRTKYDCENGSMFFMAPNQRLVVDKIITSKRNSLIMIHDDFLKGHEIRRRFKRASYFSYSVNEALHLSPKEEKQIWSLIGIIENEYNSNQDQFSKEILLTHIDLLLKYSERYYKRQFISRQNLSKNILSKLDDMLFEYFNTDVMKTHGMPSVEDIAGELQVSTRYLSDLIKTETGNTALQYIHLFLIDEAKNLLLENNLTIEKVALKLGFEYSHYFSRLFKKKVGISPTEYREQFNCLN